MQINCIFNHSIDKEIIHKDRYFFEKSIPNLLLSYLEENKTSRRVNLLQNTSPPPRRIVLSLPAGEEREIRQ